VLRHNAAMVDVRRDAQTPQAGWASVTLTGGGTELRLTCSRATLFLVEVTMETQNITLSIPKQVLIKVKVIAARRQTSVSGMLTEMLERLVQQEDAYDRASRHHLQWLEEGEDMGTGGEVLTRRDELHERA
jgi:hypothetical protein